MSKALRSARPQVIGLILLCWLGCILSCDETPARVGDNSIFPIREGNKWTYRIWITSDDGVVTLFPHLDSVTVVGDTILNGIRYWVQVGSLSGTVYLRDSSDCVLMRQLDYEQIIYSRNRDTLLLDPPIYKIITNINEITEVPAGKFRTSDCRTLLRIDEQNPHDHFPLFGDKFYSVEHYICSEEVGLVKNIYYHLGGMVETELLTYQLN